MAQTSSTASQHRKAPPAADVPPAASGCGSDSTPNPFLRVIPPKHIARLFNDEQQAEAIRRRLARAEHIDIDALYAAEALKLTGKVLWIIGPTAILLLVAGLTVTFV